MNVYFLEPARRDLRNAVRYFNDNEPGLGQELAHAVKNTISRIKAFPLLWAKVSTRLRRCRLKSYPYSLFYHLTDEKIIIVSVFHDSQNPLLWKEREEKLR